MVIDDTSSSKTKRIIKLAHPARIALGEVIVDCHDMDAFAAERIEIDWCGRHKRLPLAGFHLCDVTLVQCNTGNQLHIIVPLSESAITHLTDKRKCIWQYVIERRFLFL